MERRSLFKAMAAAPFFGSLFSEPRKVRAAEVIVQKPAEGCESSLADAFDKIRAFVAERPSSLTSERGGTVVLSADNPEGRTIGWSCFRLASDGRGNLILDGEGKKQEEAILVRIRLTDLKDSVHDERIDPRVLALVGRADGRMKLAAWLMSGDDKLLGPLQDHGDG